MSDKIDVTMSDDNGAGLQPPVASNGSLVAMEALRKDLSGKKARFGKFLQAHRELERSSDLVSPKVFRKLYESHYSPLKDNCLHIMETLQDTWQEIAVLPSTEKTRLDLLKSVAAEGQAASADYDLLLRRINKTLQVSTLRVDWFKHKNQEHHLAWLERKRMELNHDLSGRGISGLGANLRSASKYLSKAIKNIKKGSLPAVKPGAAFNQTGTKFGLKDGLLPTPSTDSMATVSPVTPNLLSGGALPGLILSNSTQFGDSPSKRSSTTEDSEDDLLPASKKAKQIKAGTWWGPDNEHLIINQRFNEVIQWHEQYMSYDPLDFGSLDLRQDLENYLTQALKALKMEKYKDTLLQTGDNPFDDPHLRPNRAPAFLMPDGDRFNYTGRNGHPGLNHFKRILGGGLTAAEKKKGKSKPRKLFPSLVGGADPFDDSLDSPKSATPKQKKAEISGMTWSSPKRLWKKLGVDATMPESPASKDIKGRVPLMCPDKDLSISPRRTLRNEFTKIYAEAEEEYQKCRHETSYDGLKGLETSLGSRIEETRRSLLEFIKDNIKEDAVLKTRSVEEKAARYGTKKGHDIRRGLTIAFELRKLQVMKLQAVDKLYEEGGTGLLEVMEEETQLLSALQLSERMWREYDDIRWFECGSVASKAINKTRSDIRRRNIAFWKAEEDRITKYIEQLRKDPSILTKPPQLNTSDPPFKVAETPQKKPGPSKQPTKSGSTYPMTPDSVERPKKPTKVSSTPSNHGVEDDGEGIEDNGVYGIEDDGEGIEDNGVDGEEAPEEYGSPAESENTPGKLAPLLDYFRKLRDSYDKKLGEAISNNNRLDAGDPGNHHSIYINNIDIMAKQQVLWSISHEIVKLQESQDPTSDSAIESGAKIRWNIPSQDDIYLRHTVTIPKKKPLPLGITSHGVGPLPGEHPTPGIPNVLVGTPAGFGHAAPGADTPHKKGISGVLKPLSGVFSNDLNLAGLKGPAEPKVPTQSKAPTQTKAPTGPPQPPKPTGTSTGGVGATQVLSHWKQLWNNYEGFKSTQPAAIQEDEIVCHVNYFGRLNDALRRANHSLSPFTAPELKPEEYKHYHGQMLHQYETFLRSHGIKPQSDKPTYGELLTLAYEHTSKKKAKAAGFSEAPVASPAKPSATPAVPKKPSASSTGVKKTGPTKNIPTGMGASDVARITFPEFQAYNWAEYTMAPATVPESGIMSTSDWILTCAHALWNTIKQNQDIVEVLEMDDFEDLVTLITEQHNNLSKYWDTVPVQDKGEGNYSVLRLRWLLLQGLVKYINDMAQYKFIEPLANLPPAPLSFQDPNKSGGNSTGPAPVPTYKPSSKPGASLFTAPDGSKIKYKMPLPSPPPAQDHLWTVSELMENFDLWRKEGTTGNPNPTEADNLWAYAMERAFMRFYDSYGRKWTPNYRKFYYQLWNKTYSPIPQSDEERAQRRALFGERAMTSIIRDLKLEGVPATIFGTTITSDQDGSSGYTKKHKVTKPTVPPTSPHGKPSPVKPTTGAAPKKSPSSKAPKTGFLQSPSSSAPPPPAPSNITTGTKIALFKQPAPQPPQAPTGTNKTTQTTTYTTTTSASGGNIGGGHSSKSQTKSKKAKSAEELAGIEGSDGWPALGRLLVDTYRARLAHQVLAQKPPYKGKPAIEGGRPGFPAPRYANVDIEDVEVEVAEL